MTAAQARALVESGDIVTIARGPAEWAGRAIGFVDKPCVLLEQPDGRKVALPIAGSQVVDRT